MPTGSVAMQVVYHGAKCFLLQRSRRDLRTDTGRDREGAVKRANDLVSNRERPARPFLHSFGCANLEQAAGHQALSTAFWKTVRLCGEPTSPTHGVSDRSSLTMKPIASAGTRPIRNPVSPCAGTSGILTHTAPFFRLFFA